MSNERVDKILEILDNATQHPMVWIPIDTGGCWRCHGPVGKGPSGICDRCRDRILDEVES